MSAAVVIIAINGVTALAIGAVLLFLAHRDRRGAQ